MGSLIDRGSGPQVGYRSSHPLMYSRSSHDLASCREQLTYRWVTARHAWLIQSEGVLDGWAHVQKICLSCCFQRPSVTRRHGSRCEPYLDHTGTLTGCDPWQQDPTSCGDFTSINTLKRHRLPQQPHGPTKPGPDTKTTQLENRNAWVKKRKGWVGEGWS